MKTNKPIDFDAKGALEILSDFFTEVSKELRKKCMSDLHFTCSGFNLSFIVTEKGGIV